MQTTLPAHPSIHQGWLMETRSFGRSFVLVVGLKEGRGIKRR